MASPWELGQFVPIRFKLIDSELFQEWLKNPRSLALYIYMRRYVWRSRGGRLGGYYQRGFLCVEGFLGTWANAFNVSKATISREMTWMKTRGIVRQMQNARDVGGERPNIYALGQVYDIPGGDDKDAVEIYYADYVGQVKAASLLSGDDTPLLALKIHDEMEQLLLPRGPIAQVQKGVAQVQKGVAQVQKGVAQVQRSNREEIEKHREEIDQNPLSPTQEQDVQEGRQAHQRARFGKDPAEGMLLAHARKANDTTSFTVPETAGGADAYKDGPLTQWCHLIGRQRANLTPSEEKSWASELRRLAEFRGANAETLTWALRQWGRAIVAYALNKSKVVWFPGNIQWKAPTPNFLYAHEQLSTDLAPLLEWGMEHGLADLDLEHRPDQNTAVEREEPPPRLEI
jgi:hypothetical protein